MILGGVDNSMKGPNGRKVLEELPILQLNSWSAFIVLMSFQNYMFEFSQESMVTRTFIDDEEINNNMLYEEEDASVEQTSEILHDLRSRRRGQLAGMGNLCFGVPDI
jgi:hypothetical protein